MKNLNYKQLKLTILFLIFISSVQILVIPLSRIYFQRLMLQPLPEGTINSFIINICKRNISKNADPDSIIGFLCSKK